MTKEELLIRFAELAQNKDMKEAVRLLQSLRSLEGGMYRAAEYFMQYFVMPTISNGAPPSKQIPFEVNFFLFSHPKNLEWGGWLDYFPDSIVEVREDKKPHGKTLLYGLPAKKEWGLERKAGVFYSPNGFKDKPSEGHITRRSIDNIKSFNAVWCDFDVGHEKKDECKKFITSLPVTPSMVVETKNGFHVLFRLGGECTKEEWQPVQNGFIELTKSDKACKDASRLLRYPGSYHCKEMWDGGEPFLVSLVWLSDRVYHISALQEAFVKERPQQQPQPRYSNFVPKGYWPNPRLPKPTLLLPGERHGGLTEEAGRIYRGLDPARASDARQLLKQWYSLSSKPLKEGWESEVDAMADFIEAREYGMVMSR